MDFTTISQFIGSLGFPIAVCCYMFYSMEKERESRKQEMDKLTEALHNNTLVIQKLVDALSMDDVKHHE